MLTHPKILLSSELVDNIVKRWREGGEGWEELSLGTKSFRLGFELPRASSSSASYRDTI